MPTVDEPLRWVSKDCGDYDISFITAPTDSEPQCETRNQHDGYVLAVGWPPEFCEHYP